MDCASAVGAVSTEVELAVAINLLVSLWGQVHKTQQASQDEIVGRVRNIASGDRLKGESVDSALNTVLRMFSVAQWLWPVGRRAGIVSAATIYLGVWLLYLMGVQPDWSEPLWMLVLSALALVSPMLLLIMAIIGRTSNDIAGDLGDSIATLDDSIRKKHEDAEQRMADVHSILSRALRPASSGAVGNLASAIVAAVERSDHAGDVDITLWRSSRTYRRWGVSVAVVLTLGAIFLAVWLMWLVWPWVSPLLVST